MQVNRKINKRRLLYTCRMLQNISSGSAEFDSGEMEEAKQMGLEVAKLQDRLVGKGVFRRFLEDRMAAESEAEMACSSPAFAAAASLMIRSVQQLENQASNKLNTIAFKKGEIPPAYPAEQR